jgi:hypothetical protein
VSFISSEVSLCAVLKQFTLLPVMLVTVRPQDLVLKCEGKRYLDECHKKNFWPKGERRKTRLFSQFVLRD